MVTNLADAAGLSDLLRQAPPGCVLYWARGVVVGNEVVPAPGNFTHLQVADVDNRGKAYEWRIDNIQADFAQGDAVSILGHVAYSEQTNHPARLVLNHNTGRWFKVFPFVPVGLPDPVTMNMERDWLHWTGKPKAAYVGSANSLLIPASWLGCVGLFFAGYVLAVFCIFALHLGGFTVLVLAGAAFFVWRRWKKSRVNLQPLYQEIVNRLQQWAERNPDPDSLWETRRRF